MKTKTILFFLILLSFTQKINAQKITGTSSSVKDFDYFTAFIDTLNHLALATDNQFFRLHCESMVAVIESKTSFTSFDSSLIEDTYVAFNDESDTCNAKDLSTYLKRRRSFILSWVSPTDGAVSFSWMKPPANWNPEQKYPLYIQLHGLWDVAGNIIQYLTYPYLNNPSTSIAFEDGYLLSPWGRGNLWYQGISETDIWECISAMEEITSINQKRKYLSGHSMGGYGAWHIAINSPDTWAALGIHAGALWYGGESELNSTVAYQLRNVPTYFVCGDIDGLLGVNQQAYQLLLDAGNQHLKFVIFGGGHEYLEENVINMYLWMKEFVNDDLNAIKTLPLTSVPGDILSYPNPFNSFAQIVFNVAKPGFVILEIYNNSGQLVEKLAAGEFNIGKHNLTWEPNELPPGVYYVLLRTDSYTETAKLIYQK